MPAKPSMAFIKSRVGGRGRSNTINGPLPAPSLFLVLSCKNILLYQLVIILLIGLFVSCIQPIPKILLKEIETSVN